MTAWFAFFGRDFLASTLGWSAEERGHYVALLIAQWEQDGLPDDLRRLELISPGIRACWPVLEEKFPIGAGGRRRNHRLEHERHKAQERSELARQSASKRWSKEAAPAGAAEAENGKNGDVCHRICDGTCGGICDGTCRADASMSMSYSPPPPPPPPRAEAGETQDGWLRLRKAWNDAWGEKRAWRSIEPPAEAIARLAEPGWLEEAITAIPEIKRGLCSGWKTPPTLRQFCGKDERGTFLARMLGGEFVDQERQTTRREPART